MNENAASAIGFETVAELTFAMGNVRRAATELGRACRCLGRVAWLLAGLSVEPAMALSGGFAPSLAALALVSLQ
jgi:hypothetical protein